MEKRNERIAVREQKARKRMPTKDRKERKNQKTLAENFL